MTDENASKDGARIPEGPEDMPGGPHGGKPITPADAEKRKKEKERERDADDDE